MSQRWVAFVIVSSIASAAFAQGATPPADPAASQVPAPPPAAATSTVPAGPPATPPTAVPPAPNGAQPDAGTTGTAPPATTPAPAPAPQQGAPPPPPTFPQGADEPPSTTESVEVMGQAEDLPPAPPPPEPLGWFGLTLSLGYAFGGDDLQASAVYFAEEDITAEIAAGTGTQFGIGVVFMPIRTEGHSIGVSVDQSIKFASIDARNLSVALVRFPLVVSARYSYAISDTWHFTAGGGLVYEYGIKLSGDGDAEDLDADFENAAGFMAEAGVAYRERSFVIDVTLRFTSLEYEPEPESVEQVSEGPFDAKSGALVVAGHYFF